MSITKIIQKKFSNVFIAFISEKNEYVLKYIVVKNGNIIKRDEKRFATDGDRGLSSDIKEFLFSIKEKYRFVYTSFLLDSLSQNCVSTCKDDDMSKYNIDKDKIIKICVDETWMVYTSKTDIKWVEEIFEEVELDFIFSPFLVLNNFIHKPEYRNRSTVHMQYMENSLTILIFNKKNIVFSAFFKIPYKEFNFEEDEELKPESSENITEGIEIDNIESEDEEFEGFVDITKFEDEDEDEDFNESEDILNSVQEDIKSSTLEDLELYGREVIIFKYLQSAIEEYYKNSNYDSEFIEDIIIYNDSNISNDIITMIENDLFLNVEIHNVDVKEEMINMSIKEVDF